MIQQIAVNIIVISYNMNAYYVHNKAHNMCCIHSNDIIAMHLLLMYGLRHMVDDPCHYKINITMHTKFVNNNLYAYMWNKIGIATGTCNGI